MKYAMYHEGYQEAVKATIKMDEHQLLQQLDALLGRDNLPDDYTENDLRSEALEQLKQDFITDYGKGQTPFIEATVNAIKRQI